MQLALDSSSPVPLFAQIADSIRWRISVGDLKTDDELPAARTACEIWGVNRHTIGRAYRELERAGLVRRSGRKLRIARVGTRASRAMGTSTQFVKRVMREALAHGLTALELVDSIRQEADLDPRKARTTVLECTRDQCEDICRQIKAATGLMCESQVLDEIEDPPPGLLIGTRFHQEEMLERWADRAGDMLFVSASVDPAVNAIVRHVCGESAPEQVTLLVKEDLVAGHNLVADVQSLIGSDCQVDLIALNQVQTRIDDAIGECTTLATPYAWRALPESLRRRPNVVRLRYAMEPGELHRLARVLDWTDSRI